VDSAAGRPAVQNTAEGADGKAEGRLIMTGPIVGILLERHPDHIVLSNGTEILLKNPLSADHVPLGRSVSVTCSVRGDKKLAHHIRLNPDWLLDSAAAWSLDD
jgi:hypothetical protein